MKTLSSAKLSTRSKDQSERQAFFEKAYLSLLSSALSQFEVRDKNGDLQTVYDHCALAEKEQKAIDAFFRHNERLDGRARQIALQRSIDQSDDLAAQVRDQDEEWRIEILVDRCYKMAQAATDLYFQQLTFSEEC
jgi:hypothetical protein